MVSPTQLVVSAASKEDTFEERVGKGLSYGLLFGSLYGLTSAYWGTSNLIPASKAVRNWGALGKYTFQKKSFFVFVFVIVCVCVFIRKKRILHSSKEEIKKKKKKDLSYEALVVWSY